MKVTRIYHEQQAVSYAMEAARAAMYVSGHPTDYARVIKANRAIAHARTHLVSIGMVTNKRADRLWAFVCKIDRAVAAATAKMEPA